MVFTEFFKSRLVWANILSIASVILLKFGNELTAAQQADVLTALLTLSNAVLQGHSQEAVDLKGLWDALARLIQLAAAYVSGWVTKGFKNRADEAEKRSQGISGRLDLEANLRGLPDSELDERRQRADRGE